MNRTPLFRYVVVAYLWTWVMMLPVLLANRGLIPRPVPHEWEALAAFGPFVAALLVLRGAGREERAEFQASLCRFDVHRGWLAFALLSPFAFLLGAVAIVTVTGGVPDFGNITAGRLSTWRGVLDLFFVSSVLQGLGEEPGWRGYLLPRLRKVFGPLAASLVIFPVWLLWHLPFFLSRPEFGIAQFAGFSLGILSASLWMTLLWDATRSSGLAVVWHTLLNITRGIAGALSTPAFLAYGVVVMAGAVLIGLYWTLRGRPKSG
jgi:membrane protease YdiL (CAAX protease family)